MSKAIAKPAWLKNLEVPAGGIDDMVSATSVPRITMKGSKFHFLSPDGEETKTVNDEIYVIILDVTPKVGFARYYYESEDISNRPPDCSSENGIKPDDYAPSKQSEMCYSCPQNEFSKISKYSKKKTKPCKSAKLLRVVDAADPGGEIYLVKASYSSCRDGLNPYGAELKAQGVPNYSVVVTRIYFDTSSDFPTLRFELKGYLNEKIGKTTLERSEKKEWETVTRPAMPAPQEPKMLPETLKEAEQMTAVVTEAAPPSAGTESIDDILNQWSDE